MIALRWPRLPRPRRYRVPGYEPLLLVEREAELAPMPVRTNQRPPNNSLMCAGGVVTCRRSVALIRRRLLDVIDYEHIDRVFLWFQFQPKLFLQGCEDRR